MAVEEAEEQATDDEFSIDELARRSGSNVRNVRLYQERGLLPPPRRVGRSNWYGPEHQARMELILSMLAKGYPLAAIRELLEAWQGQRSLADILGFEEALSASFMTEEPRHYTAEEVLEMFPTGDAGEAERLFQKAAALELLIPDGDGFLAPSPSFVETGAKLVADGVPVSALLDAADTIRRTADKLAKTFVDLFVRHVWEPFVNDGMPPERLPEITAALERARPLATQAVVPVLAQAMEKRVNKVTAEQSSALFKRPNRRGR
jgi:DNA-binding transcriptional MerR regulator